ncbi:MAG: hypothetical protein GY869_11885 [Planctomycetes bacterium]|nr:hypothetical protein [Planctomycetota bacterium]
MRDMLVLTGVLLGLMSMGGCEQNQMKDEIFLNEVLPVQANMVFLYYRDLEGATAFYEKTIGLEKVADYGFAKIFQASPSMFLGLVDEKEGMHKADEPKTVTLAFVTEQVDMWYAYLQSKGVTIRNPLGDATRHPTRGFVALDPEGYFLEFETFLDHPQNVDLRSVLENVPAYHPPNLPGDETEAMAIQAHVIWLYYNDIPAAQGFYEEVFGSTLLVDQGFAKVYSSGPASFIGLVDQSQGLHKYSKEKSVTVCFLSEAIDGWYEHVQEKGLEIRSPLAGEGRVPVRTFVTYDIGEYFLEFDHFLPHKENERILNAMMER